jgi:hypothetical protein
MPKTWPFIQAGLFLAALAFPNGIADLWNRLEAEVRKGARLWRILATLAFMVSYLAIDKLGWMPVALTRNAFAGIQIKYWILIAAAVVLSWGRVARAAIPLLGLTWFIVTEAFGLMPSSFGSLKYILVLLTIGIYIYLETEVAARVSRRIGAWRSSRAAATPRGDAL